MNVDGKENMKLGIVEKGAGGRDEEVGCGRRKVRGARRDNGDNRPGRNEGGKIGIALCGKYFSLCYAVLCCAAQQKKKVARAGRRRGGGVGRGTTFSWFRIGMGNLGKPRREREDPEKSETRSSETKETGSQVPKVRT